MNYPTVKAEICIGCGLCDEICPANTIEFENGKAKIIENKWRGYNACQTVCPVETIL